MGMGGDNGGDEGCCLFFLRTFTYLIFCHSNRFSKRPMISYYDVVLLVFVCECVSCCGLVKKFDVVEVGASMNCAVYFCCFVC